MQNPTNFIPEITNLIEWENATSLSEEEQVLLREFEKSMNNQQLPENDKKPKHIFSESTENLNNIEFQKISSNLEIHHKTDDMDEIITELKEIKTQNIGFFEILEKILANLDTCEGNLKEMSLTKANLIKKINDLYQESSEIIEQQKNLLDFSTIIKSNLLYYTEYRRIEKDIDNIHLNLSTKESFENNLQRYLSEIMDGIIFFEMKQNYKNNKIYYENYSKLKKRLLLVIKTLFLKILNKEFTEISSNTHKIQLINFFSHYSLKKDKELDKIGVPTSTRSLFLITFYPEFRNFFSENLIDDWFDFHY